MGASKDADRIIEAIEHTKVKGQSGHSMSIPTAALGRLAALAHFHIVQR